MAEEAEVAAEARGQRNPPNGLDVQNGFEGPRGKGGSITVNLRPPKPRPS